MKAVMNERGVITISAETPMESYALKNWAKQSCVTAKIDSMSGDLFIKADRLVVDLSPNTDTTKP